MSRKVEQAAFGGGADHLREDINVMFRTSIGIEENMQKPSRMISVFSLMIWIKMVMSDTE